MRVAWNNFLNDAVLTPSSTQSARDLEDLKVPHLTRTFSFGTFSGNIVFDLGLIKNVTCFALGGTNLNPTDTIILNGNNTNEWSDPDFTVAVPYYLKNQLLFLNQSYRYWRVDISSSRDMVNIGHLFIGQYIQMPGIDPDMNFDHNRTDALTLSGGLQPYGDSGFSHFAAKFTFPFIKNTPQVINGKTIATRAEILEMWDSIGSITPVYMCIWEENLNLEPPIFGVFNQSKIGMERIEKYKAYKTELNFQETK